MPRRERQRRLRALGLEIARVIARATERAIEPGLFSRPMHFKCHTALGRRFLQRGLGLEVIDADVLGLIHRDGTNRREG